MNGVGLEVLLEGLIPEIAYSGENGEFQPCPSSTTAAYQQLASLPGARHWHSSYPT